MGKSKKKKKKSSEVSFLSEIDKNLISQYEDISEDIERFQYQLARADKKTKKKYKKCVKSGKKFDPKTSDSYRARKKILDEWEDDDFLGRTTQLFKDSVPILKIIGRLVAALIVAVLSMDIVKVNIKKETLDKVQAVFSLVMGI